jgi:hypothetical protein
LIDSKERKKERRKEKATKDKISSSEREVAVFLRIHEAAAVFIFDLIIMASLKNMSYYYTTKLFTIVFYVIF